MRKNTQEFEDKLETMIDFLSLTIPKRNTEQAVKSLNYFKKAEPFVDVDVFSKASSDDGENRILFIDAEPADVGNNVDVSFVSKFEDTNSTISLQRIRLVKPKLLRGKIAYYMPYIFEHTVAFLDSITATYDSGRQYIGYDGKHWKICGDMGHRFLGRLGKVDFDNYSGIAEDDFPVQCRMAIGMEFTRYYEWSVEIGYAEQPTIYLATDPVGASEIFKLRDIPNGKKRRTALRNWVREHWREKRSGGYTGVKKHLRGAEKFTWNGLNVTIRPSRDDLKIAKNATSPTSTMVVA